MDVHDIKIYNEAESGSLKVSKGKMNFTLNAFCLRTSLWNLNLAFVLKYLFSAVKACNISLTLKDDKDTREE